MKCTLYQDFYDCVHLFTEERNSDVVKRIRLQKGKMPFYLLSLIEHKSEVDYKEDVTSEYLEKVTANTPEYLLGIMKQVIEVLLRKINVPQEEAAEFTEQVKERKMGELFANFEAYDVQATRAEGRKNEILPNVSVKYMHNKRGNV